MVNGYDTKERVSLDVYLEAGSTPNRLSYDKERGDIKQDGMYYTAFSSTPTNSTHDLLISWYANGNNEPETLISLLRNNPILLGLIVVKCSIMYGRGLCLYRKEGATLTKLEREEWPEQIRDFYEYNELGTLAYESMMDHEMIGNAFQEVIFNRGSSLAPKRIIELNRISPENVRAALPRQKRGSIRHYYLSPTWNQYPIRLHELDKIRAYNRRDFYNEGMKFTRDVNFSKVLFHLKRNLPGFPHYAIPGWYGGRKWVELHNHVPQWHISNIINMFGARVIFSVSTEYLQMKMSQIKPGTSPPRQYTEKEVQDELTKLVNDYLTNPENVGRTMMFKHGFDQNMNPVDHIIIKTIQLDLKDDAYKDLIDKMLEVVTSGIGIDPSISGIIMNGKLSSGSEKRNAWNIEVMKAFFIQEKSLEPIRFIHKFNRWDENLVWGYEPHPALVSTDKDTSGMQDNDPDPEPIDE